MLLLGFGPGIGLAGFEPAFPKVHQYASNKTHCVMLSSFIIGVVIAICYLGIGIGNFATFSKQVTLSHLSPPNTDRNKAPGWNRTNNLSLKRRKCLYAIQLGRAETRKLALLLLHVSALPVELRAHCLFTCQKAGEENRTLLYGT